jgi:hypothetical protein
MWVGGFVIAGFCATSWSVIAPGFSAGFAGAGAAAGAGGFTAGAGGLGRGNRGCCADA